MHSDSLGSPTEHHTLHVLRGIVPDENCPHAHAEAIGEQREWSGTEYQISQAMRCTACGHTWLSPVA